MNVFQHPSLDRTNNPSLSPPPFICFWAKWLAGHIAKVRRFDRLFSSGSFAVMEAGVCHARDLELSGPRILGKDSLTLRGRHVSPWMQTSTKSALVGNLEQGQKNSVLPNWAGHWR